jgi:DNA-binding NarL/FixJ family response regulator
MADTDGAGLGVLIVDDHKMFADSLARLLDDEADIHVVGVAGGASEALELIARARPDVVLLDYQLPGRDGVALAGAINQVRPDIQLIMLTGSTDDRLLLSAVTAGCSGFLTKDRAADEVAVAIRSVTSGGVPVSPPILARLFPMLARADQAPDRNLSEPERAMVGDLLQRLLN